MLYAKIVDGAVVRAITPPTAPGWEDGRWQDFAVDAVRQSWLDAHGYVPVITTPQPEDTPTHTTGLSYTVGADSVTQVWTPRPWTAEELAARTASTNRDTIQGKARAALKANATFLALTAPTNAQVLAPTNAQVLAQTKVLTRECSALIRLLLDELSTTEGT